MGVGAKRVFAAVLLAFGLAGAACASLKKDQTVCPENRNLRCMTDVQCAYDSQRGCRVCHCAPATDGVDVPAPEEPPVTH